MHDALVEKNDELVGRKNETHAQLLEGTGYAE